MNVQLAFSLLLLLKRQPVLVPSPLDAAAHIQLILWLGRSPSLFVTLQYSQFVEEAVLLIPFMCFCHCWPIFGSYTPLHWGTCLSLFQCQAVFVIMTLSFLWETSLFMGSL